jgi:hypothetical protein
MSYVVLHCITTWFCVNNVFNRGCVQNFRREFQASIPSDWNNVEAVHLCAVRILRNHPLIGDIVPRSYVLKPDRQE